MMSLASDCLAFSKYSGAGNDFILIDNRQAVFPTGDSALIAQLCHRQHGIGADGLILVEPSSRANFRMRIFNADGGEARMCGNGLRCFKQFLGQIGHIAATYTVEVAGRLLQATTISDHEVTVDMGDFPIPKWQITLPIDDEELVVDQIDTGAPHVVVFVDRLTDHQIIDWGPKVRFHQRFQPEGVNVNFVQIVDQHTIRVRTYERGIEAETLACGTGATASAMAMAHRNQANSGTITVEVQSGDKLNISYTTSPQNVTMTGPARRIFEGSIQIPLVLLRPTTTSTTMTQ